MNARGLLLALMMMTLSADRGSNPRAIAVDPGLTSGTLVVTIHGFRNAAGHARVAVFNRNAGFPDDESVAYRRVITSIHDGQAEVRFDDLTFADYAVFHVSRRERRLKAEQGAVRCSEGKYGVSNGVVDAMRAPKFRRSSLPIGRLDAHCHHQRSLLNRGSR
jgi:uncharacterized protein (DUF2141 family)